MKRYIKTEWIDNKTPVNAKNLNKIENAIETLYLDSLDVSKIRGVNGIKVVTKDNGEVEISGNIQVVPEVEGQSYDTGKVYFVLDPGTQKVKGLVVAGEFTKLGGEGDGTGDSPLGRVTFRVTTLEDTLGTLETRIGDLESRPVSKAVDLEPVNTKIGQLENRIGTLESRPVPENLDTLKSKVQALEESKTTVDEKIRELESKPVVNLTPLTERVTALENRPVGGVTGAFPKGNYDKSRYNRTVTEEEVENMLNSGTAPKHQGDSEQAAVKFSRLPEHLRAACCAYECPTAEKIMLKGGTEFIRLTDDGYDRSIFCNTTTLEVFVFKRDYINSNEQIVVYPYNMVTAKMSLSPKSSLVTSISVSNYDIYLGHIGEYGHTDILEVLADEDPVRRIQEGMLSTKHISGLSEYFTSDHHLEWMYDKFILETNTDDRYIRLKQGEIRQLFGEEPCTAFKNIANGTLYKLETESKRYDNASEIGLPMPDIKYFKGYVLGQIPGIPGTYTISEEFYADMREAMNMVIPVFPTTPKPIEPVADQIKRLLALSQSNPNSSTSTETVNLQPLTDRVAALENAPKPEDKSQEITTLQGTVAEHTTSISSNSQRITVLEGKTDILGENGKIKSNLLPESQALPSDLVRTSDLEDVVRKSALFDTEHNMILPELIPEPEVVVKWLKGKGRPDKPGTTENVIQGDEANLTRYVSTDGAGTGAWEWEKRNGSWHVVRGDTGWRKLSSGALADSSFILIRRNEVQVDVQFYNKGNWGLIKFKPMSQASKQNSTTFKLYEIQEGFRGCMAVICPLYDDNTLTQIGGINFNTQISGGGHIMTARFASNIDKEDVPGVRPGLFNFPTVDPWPSSLPGESFEAYCPST